jgi:hypothetical protein
MEIVRFHSWNFKGLYNTPWMISQLLIYFMYDSFKYGFNKYGYTASVDTIIIEQLGSIYKR